MIAALGVALTGCGGSQGEAETPPVPTVAASATVAPAASSAAAVPSAAPKADPPADPVKLAIKKASACPDWDGTSVPYGCEDYKTLSDLPALKDGAADATLVALLDDPDPKIVSLAAHAIRADGRAFRTDTAMAEKIVAMLEAGKGDDSLLENLAQAAGAVDAEKTKLGPRLLELAKKIPKPNVRASFISAGQFHNSDLLYPVTAELARSEPNAELRRAAIGSFWVGTPSDKHEEVCKLWVSIGEDPKTPDSLASSALDYAAWNPNPCEKQFDAIGKVLDKKLKGKVEESSWVSAGSHLVGQSKLPAPLKKKVVNLLKGVASDVKNNSMPRLYAMDGVLKGDPAAGKALLAKLSKDKDEYVKKRAVEATAEAAEAAAKKK